MSITSNAVNLAAIVSNIHSNCVVGVFFLFTKIISDCTSYNLDFQQEYIIVGIMYKNYKQFCHATSKTDCICFAFREHSILAVLFSAHPTADEILNEVIANSFFCFWFFVFRRHILQNEDRESPRFQPWDERPIIMTFSGLIYIIEIWRCYVIKFMYR